MDAGGHAGSSGLAARDLGEPAPRAAIGTEGTIVATWVGGSPHGVIAAVGRTTGRFGTPQRLSRAGFRPAVAIADDGTGVVVYELNRGLCVAIRRPGARRFSTSRVLSRPTGKGDEDSFATVGVDARGSALVVYVHSYRDKGRRHEAIRALTLRAHTGKATGPPVTIAAARDERGNGMQRTADGGLAVLMRIDGPADQFGNTPDSTPVILRRAPGQTQITQTAVTGPGDFGEALLQSAPDGRLAVAGVNTTSGGDAGLSGYPVAASFPADPLAAPSPFAGPQVARPARNFGAVAVPVAGDALALVWHQKTQPEGFSRRAPVWGTTINADGTVADPVRLTAVKAGEVQAVALGGGALAVWDEGRTFGAARRGAGGGWHRAPAPRGSVIAVHDYVTNRQLTSSGSTAAYIWEAKGAIRMSVLRP